MWIAEPESPPAPVAYQLNDHPWVRFGFGTPAKRWPRRYTTEVRLDCALCEKVQGAHIRTGLRGQPYLRDLQQWVDLLVQHRHEDWAVQRAIWGTLEGMRMTPPGLGGLRASDLPTVLARRRPARRADQFIPDPPVAGVDWPPPYWGAAAAEKGIFNADHG